MDDDSGLRGVHVRAGARRDEETIRPDALPGDPEACAHAGRSGPHVPSRRRDVENKTQRRPELAVLEQRATQRCSAGRNTAAHFGGLSVRVLDRKSTRLNSSHPSISYAVFCLKKKKTKK